MTAQHQQPGSVQGTSRCIERDNAMKTGSGDSASRSVQAPMEGGALSFGIRENGTVEGLNVETYYQPCVGIITDRERRCLRVFADNGATDIETRVLFSTLQTDGWTPPSTGADTEGTGQISPESAPAPDSGSPKQDDPAPVCAPLSAAERALRALQAFPGFRAGDSPHAQRFNEMLVGAIHELRAALASPCAPTSAGTERPLPSFQPALALAVPLAPVRAMIREYARHCVEAALSSPAGTVQPTTPPTPASEAVAARNVRLLTQEEVIDAMRTDYGPRPMSRVEAIQHKFCEANSIVLPFQQEEEGKHDAVAKDAQQK